MPEFTLVDRPETIKNQLNSHYRIGVDTEFMREWTFFAQLCLVQIATADHIYCVDPLIDDDMRPFWDEMLNRVWVLHSARQDIEVIYQTTECMPRRIFDTQIAAGLLGYAPQLGYAGLVNELFDIELPKSHTRADWTQRPLPAAVLKYAAEDVEYLLPAFDLLAESLDKKGRLSWAEEDSAALLDPVLYSISPQLAVLRLKGARNLRGRSRAAAARLAAWRESEALRANRPRQWIIKDNVLLNMVENRPSSAGELARIDGLAPGLLRRAGEDLLAAIGASASDNNDYEPPARADEAQKALLKMLQVSIAECAADLGLAAETIASKKELSAVVLSDNRESRLFAGWRRDIIGDQLLKLL